MGIVLARIEKVRLFILAACFLSLTACVSFPDAPPAIVTPHFSGETLISIDGAALGLTAWNAPGPKAVLVAVHGMNDYAHAFAGLGGWLSQHENIAVYAYDQRGFGRSPDFGRWPGEETMIADLSAAVAAAHAAHPGAPLFVLGHSMGAAVVMTAMREGPLDADGVILAAPGVWGGARLPILYRVALNMSASVLPGKSLTGERAGRQATDNIEILREMFADPLVIKETRLDAILGVVRLMGDGWDASNEIGGRILFLYGEKDDIIPVKAMAKTAERLCGDVETRAYPDGWHLLFRDLQAEKVWSDVGAWIDAQADAASPVSGSGPAASSCAGADGGRSVAFSATQRNDRSGV
ncbi:MAG: alpha/beta fold hydrolase [Amphiplicatus sp.]